MNNRSHEIGLLPLDPSTFDIGLWADDAVWPVPREGFVPVARALETLATAINPSGDRLTPRKEATLLLAATAGNGDVRTRRRESNSSELVILESSFWITHLADAWRRRFAMLSHVVSHGCYEDGDGCWWVYVNAEDLQRAIATYFRPPIPEPLPQAPKIAGRPPRKLKDALAFLGDLHPTERPPNIQRVAEQCGVSERTMKRAIKEKYG